MVAAFGTECSPAHHFPASRIAENWPCLNVFELYGQGLLEATVGSLSPGHKAGFSIVSHGGHRTPMFRCSCGRGAYKIYCVNDRFACRACHALDWQSRHRHRSIKGLTRCLMLRRKLKAEPRPFGALPTLPKYAPRKHAILNQLFEVERGLLGNLQTVNRDLE